MCIFTFTLYIFRTKMYFYTYSLENICPSGHSQKVFFFFKLARERLDEALLIF